MSDEYESKKKSLETQHAKDKKHLESDIERLSKDRVRLASKVKVLSDNHARLESAAEQMTKSYLDMLEKMQKSTLKSISDVSIRANKSTASVSEQSVKDICNAAEATTSALKETAHFFDSMICDISNASEKFGQMYAVHPIFEILTGSDVNRTQGCLAVISLLNQLLESSIMHNANHSLRADIMRVRTKLESMVSGNASTR